MRTSSVFPSKTCKTLAHLFAIRVLIFSCATRYAIRCNCCHRCMPNHQNGAINACATHRQWWSRSCCDSSPRHRCIGGPMQMACQACNNCKQVLIDLYSLHRGSGVTRMPRHWRLCTWLGWQGHTMASTEREVTRYDSSH